MCGHLWVRDLGICIGKELDFQILILSIYKFTGYSLWERGSVTTLNVLEELISDLTNSCQSIELPRRHK